MGGGDTGDGGRRWEGGEEGRNKGRSFQKDR